jgi:riboflavin synthase
MFSGIIKSIGVLESISPIGTNRRLVIASPIAGELNIDQSISHDGICLTIVDVKNGIHEVDVVQETLIKTNFQFLKAGQLINLEKSITPTSLLDGHLVQGHVDTFLECLQIEDKQGSWNIKFNLPDEFASLVIPRGSICLNGVSLTISNIYDDSFEVAIIPYTYDHTNFHLLREGNYVNVEFDLIGKYLLRQAEVNILR